MPVKSTLFNVDNDREEVHQRGLHLRRGGCHQTILQSGQCLLIVNYLPTVGPVENRT